MNIPMKWSLWKIERRDCNSQKFPGGLFYGIIFDLPCNLPFPFFLHFWNSLFVIKVLVYPPAGSNSGHSWAHTAESSSPHAVVLALKEINFWMYFILNFASTHPPPFLIVKLHCVLHIQEILTWIVRTTYSLQTNKKEEDHSYY